MVDSPQCSPPDRSRRWVEATIRKFEEWPVCRPVGFQEFCSIESRPGNKTDKRAWARTVKRARQLARDGLDIEDRTPRHGTLIVDLRYPSIHEFIQALYRTYGVLGPCPQCSSNLDDPNYSLCSSCRKQKREYERGMRELSRNNGICQNCWTRPVDEGISLCRECADQMNERAKDLRKKFKKKGLCNKCGSRPPAPGLNRCVICQRAERRRRYAQKGRVCDVCGKSDSEVVPFGSLSSRCWRCQRDKLHEGRSCKSCGSPLGEDRYSSKDYCNACRIRKNRGNRVCDCGRVFYKSEETCPDCE